MSRVTDLVKQGFNTGLWTGNGIDSSTAAGDATHLHALGVILNNNGQGGAIYSSFEGQSADANSILIDYTFYGDADLNSRVDGGDYALIDNGFNMPHRLDQR